MSSFLVPEALNRKFFPDFLLTFLLLWIILLMSSCDSSQTTSEDEQSEEQSRDTTVSTNQHDQDSIILFFGNSLTAGYGIELAQAFPALIQEKIDSLGLTYEVRNSGLSGETSAGGNSRIDFVLNTLQQPLAVFVLELGANDGLRGLKVEETRENLQSIIDKVKEKHPETDIILCGMEAPPNMGDDFTQSFREVFPQLARTNDITLVPFLLEGVAGEPALNLPDGIHPTPEGHEIVAENVWKYLKELL